MRLYQFLKRIRVILSLLVFVGIFLYFSAVQIRTMGFLSPLLKLQFIPSLLASFTGAFAVCLVIILLTLLFGRVYCSLLCPMGTLQDISIRVANLFKSKKQKRFHYKRPHTFVRYFILTVVAVCGFVGFSLPLLMLDPYSNFGRIVTHLFGPVVLWMNNQLSYLAPQSFYYLSCYSGPFWMYFFLALVFLAIVGLSAVRGRLFCNSVCPAGSFLGLISKHSVFRLSVDKSKCNHCAICGTKCKAECIDTGIGKVDHSRCVACFNCTLACSQEALYYTFSWKKHNTKSASIAPKSASRRTFLSVASGLTGAAALYRITGGKSLACAHSKSPLSPPGAISYAHLKEFCTACQACVSACPSHALRPSFSSYGIDGLMLPELDFTKGFCQYECNVCMTVCPTNALKYCPIEEKQLIQTGKARFFPGRCVVTRDQTDCGACAEHCPTKAVHMVPYGNGLRIPQVDDEYCVGCGGCEYICPARPKAIIVQPQSVHTIASPPVIEKQEKIEVDGFGF